jgi:hypothetical protein
MITGGETTVATLDFDPHCLTRSITWLRSRSVRRSMTIDFLFLLIVWNNIDVEPA